MSAPSGFSIRRGYLINVDPDGDPASGNLVVVKQEDTQEAALKKLVIDAGQKCLQPIKPSR